MPLNTALHFNCRTGKSLDEGESCKRMDWRNLEDFVNGGKGSTANYRHRRTARYREFPRNMEAWALLIQIEKFCDDNRGHVNEGLASVGFIERQAGIRSKF